jgi:mannose-6-phosphate isomerase-like protein (cupin superfamily)
MEPQETQEVAQPPIVASRAEIPVALASGRAGHTGEMRPFAGHEGVRRSLPPSAVALSWLSVRDGQPVGPRSEETPTMLIVLQGGGALSGATPRAIAPGDVVTIPRGREYGLTAVGPEGLHVVHVSLGEAGESGERVALLARLLDRNEARAATSLTGPLARLVQDAAVEPRVKSALLREASAVLAEASRATLLAHLALCRDEDRRAGLEALHGSLPPGDGAVASSIADPIVRATSGWFRHQASTLDEAPRSVLHLVLRSAHDDLRALAKGVLPARGTGAGSEGDGEPERGPASVSRLLEVTHPEAYEAMARALDDAWDVVDAMTRRIAGRARGPAST